MIFADFIVLHIFAYAFERFQQAIGFKRVFCAFSAQGKYFHIKEIVRVFSKKLVFPV